VRPTATPAPASAASSPTNRLAGLGTGQFSSPAEAAEVCVRHERVCEPDAARHAAYREKHALYQQLFPALQPVLNRL
jgi:sugar (pentulose or hexulose) kinase